MRPTMYTLGAGLPVLVLSLLLTQSTCQCSSNDQSVKPVGAQVPALDQTAPPLPLAPAAHPAATNCVMVYIKVVLDKKFGLLARVLGGKRDSTWQRTTYDVANPWWKNPLIVYADPPVANADVIGRADADVITGRGASGNVTVQVSMIPHADVAVATIPGSDGIRGTITTTISTVAEYYDGHWTEMVHEDDRKITFSFDTCDPLKRLEVIGSQTKTIPTFEFERYTRDEQKWEPKSNWPDQANSGDWRVVIYGKNAVMQLTSYRYVEQPVADAQR